ncbi:uncharacterized protein B0H18DRAFT_955927 [Fomitopsis serialis]|uniref:uncharacterized protein n=1 Tax=Fomitopsis serialis TaxID=139415 RepID=UPI0020085788|nr:uncharacterized protein B0H18DRAFT_955927 [Neoantrodia serialis]KAH9923223.1 hypothetical protein B0H18DRAFT_955927 [Neoantrodia serialis]
MSFLVALLGIIPYDLFVPSQTAPPVPSGVTLYFASEVHDFRKITDLNYNLAEAAPTSMLVAKLSGGNLHWWHIIDGELQSYHVKLRSKQNFGTFVQRFERNRTEGSPETKDDGFMEDEIADLYGNFRACIEYGAFDEILTHAWNIVHDTHRRMWATIVGYVLIRRYYAPSSLRQGEYIFLVSNGDYASPLQYRRVKDTSEIESRHLPQHPEAVVVSSYHKRGRDCHGLPIENKVLKKLKMLHWWDVVGRLTETQITNLNVVKTMVKRGLIYRQLRPVYYTAKICSAQR